MKELDIENWNRKEIFQFFKQFTDAYFSVIVHVDVTRAYDYSKKQHISFFVLYLHACMKALNSVENLRYRIREDKVIIHDVIHASPTILRNDNTFGFSFIHYNNDIEVFNKNFLSEKERIQNSTNLFPKEDTDDCIYCSALPWINFSGHKEPLFGVVKESVPKLAFGKFEIKDNKKLMPVSIAVNHALVDGYHVGEFVERFQRYLNEF
ncbi:MAG: chloramphenicol acetyltransferase [Flavobacteriaceae bacterium]